MDRINKIIEIAGSSNHLTAILSLLTGLFLFRKDSRVCEDAKEAPGDNVPATLIDGIGRWSS